MCVSSFTERMREMLLTVVQVTERILNVLLTVVPSSHGKDAQRFTDHFPIGQWSICFWVLLWPILNRNTLFRNITLIHRGTKFKYG